MVLPPTLPPVPMAVPEYASADTLSWAEETNARERVRNKTNPRMRDSFIFTDEPPQNSEKIIIFLSDSLLSAIVSG
jgi:hypothetical protein